MREKAGHMYKPKLCGQATLAIWLLGAVWQFTITVTQIQNLEQSWRDARLQQSYHQGNCAQHAIE